MTWLLNQLQKVLGALAGRRKGPSASDSTKLGNEIASRLHQSNVLDDDEAPVAIRLPSKSAPNASLTQSTAPLRQKNSSVLKDTVDPVAQEPDTHRRLDAAAASKTGGTTVAPSFPTDVSELISAQSTLKGSNVESLSGAIDDLPVPDVEPPVSEQLPDIHDLLPAVEPEVPDPEEPLPDAEENTTGLPSVESSEPDIPIVASAQRVSSSTDQVTLFSFDIIEHEDAGEHEAIDTSSEIDASSEPSIDEDHANTVSLDRNLLVDDTATDEIVGADAPLDASLDWETAPAPVEDVSEPTLLVDSVAPQPSSATLDPNNPWLTAKPRKEKESTEELLVKTGIVKLLFKLKPGNFHGYIAPQDGSKDVLFHQKYINAEIFDYLERGTQVTVTAKEMEGKVYATRVDLLQE